MKILIVDDKKENLYFLESLLKGFGYEVVSAVNGKDALEKLRNDSFNMIISDILMPVMDGFQLLRNVKDDYNLRDMPFVFYTATYTGDKDKEFGLKLGASKYLIKPMDPEGFIKIIQGIIGDFESGKLKSKKPVIEKEEEVFKLYSERLVQKLEKKMLDLEREVSVRKQTEEKIKHLNLVLRAIRNVNQLIIKEKNRDVLIQKICDILIENRGYANAWIVLWGEQGEYLNSAEAGLGKRFIPMKKMLEEGKLTDCGNRALKEKDVVIIEDPGKECVDCPLSANYSGRGSYSICLSHGDNIYGLLTVSVPGSFIKDKEEQDIFWEIGGDIGFALHSIEVEKKHKQAEEELLVSEEKYRTLVETIEEGIGSVDENETFVYVNKTAADIFGYSRDEMIGKNLKELTTPEMFKQILKETSLRKKGKSNKYELAIHRKNGEQRIITVTSTPNISENGVHHGSRGIFHDITERKQAEEKIQQQNVFLNRVLESLTHPFYVIDTHDYTILLANSASGFKSSLKNATCHSLTHKSEKPCQSKEHPCPMEIVIKTKKPTMVEHIHFDKDGNGRNVEVYGYPLFDNKGNVIQMIEYCLDITVRKKAEEVIKERMKELQCSYGVSESIRTRNTLDEIFLDVVELIPSGWQYPEITRGKVIFDGTEYVSEPFEETEWKQSCDIIVNGESSGSIEVYYLEKCPKMDEGPFMTEERNMINGLTRNINEAIERKQAEEKLKSSEERLKILFESAPDAYYLSDLKGTFIDGNKAAEDLMEYKKEELIGKSFLKLKLLSAKELLKASKLLLKNIQGKGTGPDEFVLNRKNGNQVSVEIRTYPVQIKDKTVVLGIARDISERKQAEEQIKKDLEIKTVLLQEVYHRVKNNMQLISSLLKLQSAYITDKRALELFKNSQDRVKSMALIHDALYRSKDMANIDFAEYVRKLTTHIFMSYDADSNLVKLKIDIKDILLNINMGIPCGMIINELVSNSFKYAFPEGRKGEISVSLTFKNQEYKLCVKDNGIGLPGKIDLENSPTLGLMLVNSLIKQLNGTLELEKVKGTSFIITFKKIKLKTYGKV